LRSSATERGVTDVYSKLNLTLQNLINPSLAHSLFSKFHFHEYSPRTFLETDKRWPKQYLSCCCHL